MDTVQLLRELSEASGVSGYEQEARGLVRKALEPFVDSLRVDALGNLIAQKNGCRPGDAPKRSIMIAAHIDEIGLMVSGLEKGLIRFARVAGVDLRTILGHEVVVHGKRRLLGVVASRPPHVLTPSERENTPPIDKLYIDVGVGEHELLDLVRVGDVIAFRQDFAELSGGYVSGKAFDDRAGVLSVILCVEMLSQMRHDWDVFAVATSQEETGLKGASVSAYGIAPDVALAVDVGFGAQRGASEDEAIAMDAGPALAIGPNVHPAVHERLVSVAKNHELPYQVEAISGASGTDAWAIQVAQEGIPTGLLSIPLRYMHTTVETVAVKDIERTARLMAHFVSSLDEGFSAKVGL